MMWRKWAYGLGLIMGLALFLRQVGLLYSNLPELRGGVVRPGFLLLALGCYLLGYLLQMSAWAVIMRYLGAQLSASQVFQGYLLAFLPRYIPGMVWGYLSRNEWLLRTCGISYVTSSIASLLEATTLLLCAAIYSLWLWGAGDWGIGLGLVTLLALGVNWYGLPWLARRLNPQRWAVAINHEQSWRLGLLGNGLYLLFWAVHGLGLFLLAQAFMPLPLAQLAPIIAAASLAWSVGFLIVFVPAGLGIRETTLVALLTQWAIMPAGIAQTVALLSRVGLVVAELLWLGSGVIAQLREKIRLCT